VEDGRDGKGNGGEEVEDAETDEDSERMLRMEKKILFNTEVIYDDNSDADIEVGNRIRKYKTFIFHQEQRTLPGMI
jgi:hypothetical protein